MAEISGPIKQFQDVEATKVGTWELVQAVNRQRPNLRENELLRRQFDRWWTDMQVALDNLPDADKKFATPMQELLHDAGEEAQECALRNGLAVFRRGGGEFQAIQSLLRMPPVDRLTGLATNEVLDPLTRLHNACVEAHLASEALRESFEDNLPDELGDALDVSASTTRLDRACAAKDELNAARDEAREALSDYFESLHLLKVNSENDRTPLDQLEL